MYNVIVMELICIMEDCTNPGTMKIQLESPLFNMDQRLKVYICEEHWKIKDARMGR